MPGSCLALEAASGLSVCLQHWCFMAQLHQLQVTQALLTHPYLQVLVHLAETRGKRRKGPLVEDTRQTLLPCPGHRVPEVQSPLIPVPVPSPALGCCHRSSGARRMSAACKSSHLLYLQLPRRLCWDPRLPVRPARPWRLYLSTSS